MSKSHADREDMPTVDELRWRLSHINPNIPTASGAVVTKWNGENLLFADVIDLEHRCVEWERIAQSYRELAQIAIEAASRHYQAAVKLTRENRALRELL